MDVIDELIACCDAWEPWARVMGNVCAGDAAQALRNLRAELAVERKRQSAMRTLIASQEGTLSHYRSKQAKADEAVRTLDSERAANAKLTAELAECRKDADRYKWLRFPRLHWDVLHQRDEDSVWLDMHGNDLDIAIDAAILLDKR